VKGFREKSRKALYDYFLSEGYLSEEEPLNFEEIRFRVQLDTPPDAIPSAVLRQAVRFWSDAATAAAPSPTRSETMPALEK